VRYRNVQALAGVSLQVQGSEVLALLGRNGAGKSTAIAVLLGLRRPDSGQVQLLGGDPQHRAQREQVGVMLQSTALPPKLRVGELVEQFQASYPRPRPLAECLAIAGVQDLRERPYGALSGGQQRRVQFAIALCGGPRLLFLDEPTTGLDIEARQAIWDAIATLRQEGCGIVLTTHYLEEAEALAGRVVVMERGQVLADGPLATFRPQLAPRRIRCRSRLDVAHVRGWEGVIDARREGDHLQLLAEPAEAVVARLLAEDPLLRELDVRGGGLAEAFVEMTREAA
jgi:ABC-2 type transport system ATP-binding protein